MKTTLWLAAALVAALALGCGSSGGDNPVQPPPNDEVEPNDFTPQALGTLSTTDIVLDLSSAGLGDVDLFSVVLTAPTNLLVSVDWAGATDFELTISNASGIFVRHVDTAGHPEECTLGALPAGTYTVRVGSFGQTATSYKLTVGPR